MAARRRPGIDVSRHGGRIRCNVVYESAAMRLRFAWLMAVTAAAGLSAAGTSVGLVDAVKSGHRETVRTLIRQRVDVNAAERDGTTALHWAVRADDVEM